MVHSMHSHLKKGCRPVTAQMLADREAEEHSSRAIAPAHPKTNRLEGLTLTPAFLARVRASL